MSDLRETTRARIQAAALECFREHGYDGTSMVEIARRASVSPATLYTHFTGKGALFNSLQRSDLALAASRTKERQEAILKAALSVFGEKGYAGATMEDVARAAGLSKAALYEYFAGKQDLFAALIENASAFANVDELLNGWLSDAHRTVRPDEAESFLRRAALRYLGLFHDPVKLNLLRVVLAEGSRTPAIAATFVTPTIERGSALLAECLAGLGVSKEDLPQTARLFIGMLFAWAVLHGVLAPPANEASDKSRRMVSHAEIEMAERAARLFLCGLGWPSEKGRGWHESN